MGKVVAIIQSNYIPWKGYFDLIRRADDFVIYDQVQYTKNDWRNRNRLKTVNGTIWLTIPVRHVHLDQRIMDTHTADSTWRMKHWKTIRQAYAKTPFFPTYADELERLYLEETETNLSRINQTFIETIARWLRLTTIIHAPGAFELSSEDRTERLVDICSRLGAAEYLSGPSAKDYLDVDRFKQKGISVRWMNYDGYPIYSQPHGAFDHYVSILDLLFCTGPRAADYFKD